MCAENFWISVMRIPVALLVKIHITTRLIWKFQSRNVSFLMSFKMFGDTWSAWCSGMSEVIWMSSFGHVSSIYFWRRSLQTSLTGNDFSPKSMLDEMSLGTQVDKLSCIFCNVRTQAFDVLRLLHFVESQNDRTLPTKDVPAMCMDVFDSVLLRWPLKDMNS